MVFANDFEEDTLSPSIRTQLEELALSKGMTASSLGRFFIEDGLKKELAKK